MNTSLLGLLFIYSLVFLRLSSGASTAERAHTMRPTVDKVSPTVSVSVSGTGLHTSVDVDNYDAKEDDLSGDYEVDYPRVAFSTKPKDSSFRPITQNRRKGRGKKNPCLRKINQSFCVHGVCQYLRELNHTSCICELGFSGERCHLFTLAVGKEVEGYNWAAAFAVILVILSLMCLTFIAILLAFRYLKKADKDMESEERIKLDADIVQ